MEQSHLSLGAISLSLRCRRTKPWYSPTIPVFSLSATQARSGPAREQSNWERYDHGAKGPDTEEREREYG